MNPAGNDTYLIKIRSCNSFPFFRKRFIDLLKDVDWVVAVEATGNKACFYIETDDSVHFEAFLDNMNKEFRKMNLGNVIHSKIHNVFRGKKGVINA